MKKIFIILLFTILILVSCETEVPLFLRLTDDDPYPSKVNVKAVMEDTDRGMLYLTWEEDMGADTFIVMRAIDGSTLDFKQIYRGRDLSFEDKDFESNTAYVYRLDKKRGNKIFKGTEYSYGYYYGGANGILGDDAYEDNNSLSKAVVVESQVDATLYAVKYKTDGKILYDEDWYYVFVPANFTVNLRFNQTRPNETENTSMKLYIVDKTNDDEVIKQGEMIGLKNVTNKSQNIYFRVIVNVDTLFSSAEGGSEAVDYTIYYEGMNK